MESFEDQERRAQRQVNWKAVVKTGLVTGLIFFIMSGGGPWTTSGVMNRIMGRDVGAPFGVLFLGHFSLALLYTAVIAAVVYRFNVWLAVALGVLVGMGLYAINLAVFRGMGGHMNTPEFIAFFVHCVFGLMTSAVYKALSVPRARP